MTVESLFGLAVRLAGLAFVVFGVFDFFHVLALLTGLPISSKYSVGVDAVIGLFWLFLGAVFLGGADAITRLAYRTNR